MEIIILQLWGGVFYLLAKIFLSIAEGNKTTNGNWRLLGWMVYLIGIPAWLIVLSLDQRWIALAVEAGGIPAMIIGINSSVKNPKVISKMIDTVIKIFTIGLIVLGVFYSIHKFGGITKFTQILEMGVTVGFLVGTYLLSKKNYYGWICFLLMNLSMATLMFMQGPNRYIFAILQVISIYFVVSGFINARKIF